MMVGAGGTQTCVHLHVSHPLYHCATGADSGILSSYINLYTVNQQIFGARLILANGLFLLIFDAANFSCNPLPLEMNDVKLNVRGTL